jgi:hypothetical protein
MAGDIPNNITTGKYVRQIVVSAPGPQGPSGVDGTQAEDIPDLVSYVHNQISSSNTWIVNHNLNFYPNVTIYDSAGSMVEGSVNHSTATSLTITFSSAISGKAYLS